MNGQHYRTELRAFVGKRQKVQLTCANDSAKDIGFVLGVGRDLIWLHQFHDFFSEGYVVLRLCDILRFRSDEHERMWERMFAQEGILDQVSIPYELPLQDMPGLLLALQSRGENIIVETKDNSKNGFYIGRILSVDELSMQFATFDSLGCWDPQPDKVYFHKINRIQFETPYTRIYSKYLEGPCPHSSKLPSLGQPNVPPSVYPRVLDPERENS